MAGARVVGYAAGYAVRRRQGAAEHVHRDGQLFLLLGALQLGSPLFRVSLVYGFSAIFFCPLAQVAFGFLYGAGEGFHHLCVGAHAVFDFRRIKVGIGRAALFFRGRERHATVGVTDGIGHAFSRQRLLARRVVDGDVRGVDTGVGGAAIVFTGAVIAEAAAHAAFAYVDGAEVFAQPLDLL